MSPHQPSLFPCASTGPLDSLTPPMVRSTMAFDPKPGLGRKTYLAGPMRGYPDFNFPAFHEGAKHLRALGWEVISPAEEDIKHKEVHTKQEVDQAYLTGKTPWVERDCALINSLLPGRDAIHLLPSWEKSPGARAEKALGEWRQLEVFEPEVWHPSLRGMAEFWEDHAEWSQATFLPDNLRGPVGPLKHLAKEVQEALQDATQGNFVGLREEIVDCLFLTFDAARRAGMTYRELVDGAFAKLTKNRGRMWATPTSDEPVEHIRG